MSEHKEQSPQYEHNTESLGEAAAERSKEILASSENTPEKSIDSEASQSRERAKVERLFSSEVPGRTEQKSGRLSDSAPRHTNATKKDRDASFKHTMDQVRSEMPPHERAFSKIIHHPAIERISDAGASSVARPNAILAGSLTAFLAVTAVYVIARNYGYELSGFETIGSFILGWLVGLTYDYVRIMITGKTS